MNFNHQLLFFFSALGVFNGLILSGYFFFRKPKKLSNYFLSLLLLMIIVRIAKSIVFYFEPMLAKVFLQLGLSACLLIGPFLYFYIKSKLSSSADVVSWQLHLGLLVTVILIGGAIFPYVSYPEIWGKSISFIYYQWLVYILASAYLLKTELHKFFIKRSVINEDETWMLSVFIGTSFIWLAHYTSSYTSYIAGALSFSFVLYLLILLVIFNRKKATPAKVEKYLDKKIDNEEMEKYLLQLDKLLTQEQLFKDANLTLSQLAKKMNILPQRLSQFVNDNLNKSFSLFINEYRISAAKALLDCEQLKKMDVIAEDCGFNSNSTFYTAFKKVTGTTPAKYRDAQKHD